MSESSVTGQPNAADTTTSFETALRELDEVVQRLEGGNLSLEESLSLYERGVALAASCHQRLQHAERRIEILNERGKATAAPGDLTRDVPGEDRA
jgi:exodeoxyribonuclease VII small subunit